MEWMVAHFLLGSYYQDLLGCNLFQNQLIFTRTTPAEPCNIHPLPLSARVITSGHGSFGTLKYARGSVHRWKLLSQGAHWIQQLGDVVSTENQKSLSELTGV